MKYEFWGIFGYSNNWRKFRMLVVEVPLFQEVLLDMMGKYMLFGQIVLSPLLNWIIAKNDYNGYTDT